MFDPLAYSVKNLPVRKRTMIAVLPTRGAPTHSMEQLTGGLAAPAVLKCWDGVDVSMEACLSHDRLGLRPPIDAWSEIGKSPERRLDNDDAPGAGAASLSPPWACAGVCEFERKNESPFIA